VPGVRAGALTELVSRKGAALLQPGSETFQKYCTVGVVSFENVRREPSKKEGDLDPRSRESALRPPAPPAPASGPLPRAPCLGPPASGLRQRHFRMSEGPGSAKLSMRRRSTLRPFRPSGTEPHAAGQRTKSSSGSGEVQPDGARAGPPASAPTRCNSYSKSRSSGWARSTVVTLSPSRAWVQRRLQLYMALPSACRHKTGRSGAATPRRWAAGRPIPMAPPSKSTSRARVPGRGPRDERGRTCSPRPPPLHSRGTRPPMSRERLGRQGPAGRSGRSAGAGVAPCGSAPTASAEPRARPVRLLRSNQRMHVQPTRGCRIGPKERRPAWAMLAEFAPRKCGPRNDGPQPVRRWAEYRPPGCTVHTLVRPEKTHRPRSRLWLTPWGPIHRGPRPHRRCDRIDRPGLTSETLAAAIGAAFPENAVVVDEGTRPASSSLGHGRGTRADC